MSVRIKNQWGRDATAADMQRFLGLRPGHELPVAGVPATIVQNVTVWVEPQRPLRPGQRKRSAHRIMALCSCGQVVPTGRLHQHRCKD